MQPILTKLFEEGLEVQARIQVNKAKVAGLLAEIDIDEQRLADIHKEFKFLSRGTISQENTPNDYQPGWSNINKALYVIKKEGRCLTVREIASAVAEIDYVESIKTYISTLSSALSTDAVKKRRVGRYQQYSGGDWLYGPIDWFDSDGNFVGNNTQKNG